MWKTYTFTGYAHSKKIGKPNKMLKLPTDGMKGGVGYDDNDRYCLDGQRLIAIRGQEGP